MNAIPLWLGRWTLNIIESVLVVALLAMAMARNRLQMQERDGGSGQFDKDACEYTFKRTLEERHSVMLDRE